MSIYIPTYGRPERQQTFKRLPKDVRQRVVFVVRPSEEAIVTRLWHHQCGGVLTHKSPGVADARQTALEKSSTDKVCFFDDDLRFCRRKPGWVYNSDTRLDTATAADVSVGVQWLEDYLDLYPCTALGGRGGNIGIRHRWMTENSRIMRSFAICRWAMNDVGVRFDDFYYWEDFHVALSLLEQGYPNAVSTDIVTDGITNYEMGGVTRDVSKMWEVAKRFAATHPHAKLKMKIFRWGGPTLEAPDFTIAWKKAYRSKVGGFP